MNSLQIFLPPRLSLESSIIHCLHENFPEYPREITIGVSTTVYSISQQFSWLNQITNCTDYQIHS